MRLHEARDQRVNSDLGADIEHDAVMGIRPTNAMALVGSMPLASSGLGHCSTL
jgi:hypothetical protein